MTTQGDSPTPLVSEWMLSLDDSPYKMDIQYTNLNETGKYIDTLNIATTTTTKTTITTTTTTTRTPKTKTLTTITSHLLIT